MWGYKSQHSCDFIIVTNRCCLQLPKTLFDEIASGAFVVYSEGINDIIEAENWENLSYCV